ncbi:MAG: dihydrofolate reductase [Patescibacteria group bacterium]
MNFSIIVAIDEKGGIGKNNTLPWHLPADLKHFKELTTGGTVIMGRNTWESIPDKFRPLPNRLNIVLTGNLNYFVPEGVKLASSLDGALAVSEGSTFIIGGAKVFEEAIRHEDCSDLFITKIESTFDCDTFFPFLPLDFQIVHEGETLEDNEIKFKFLKYSRELL